MRLPKKMTHLEVSRWPHCFFHPNTLFTYLGEKKNYQFEVFFFFFVFTVCLPACGVGQFSEGAFQRCGAVDAPPTFGYFWLRTFKTWCIRTLPRNWWFSWNDYITNRQAPQIELRSDSPREYAVAMVGKDERKKINGQFETSMNMSELPPEQAGEP